ncbi:MAG: hypothetical protein B7Y99_10200 [Caulobacterales bacterium 32-69-10]|nr:MAG: hypothetical protein B7Y99_10200 [Caulobacterales bacterium 32-69-10]
MIALLRSLLVAFGRSRAGGIALIAALCLPVILAAVGGAVDLLRASTYRSQMQSALDAAVLAAVQVAPDQRSDVGLRFFNAGMEGASVLPAVSFVTKADGNLAGTARAELPTYLLSLIKMDTLPVRAAATAARSVSANKVCLLLLDPTGGQALLVNSGANVQAPNCEVHVRSTGSPAAIFNGGSTLNTAKICIRGTTIIDNGGVHPNLEKGCAAIADPFAGTMPAPPSTSCQYNNLNYNGGAVTLNPGVYCGWVNFNGTNTVTFKPGVYTIKGGGWNVNGGSWTGSGVTFYFADTSKIQFNSAVSGTLSAPTSGAHSGILFYEAAGLSKSAFILNDSANTKWTGLVYLPSRNATYNSGATLTSPSLTLVFNRLILNSVKWSLTPSQRAPSGGQTAGGGVRLVE